MGRPSGFPEDTALDSLGLKLSTKSMVGYQGMSYACGSLLTLIHRERIGRKERRMRERREDREGDKEGRKTTLV